AYSQLVRSGKTELGGKVNFCVPTGNFGNILAGYIARDMGLPVNKLICASNANNVLTDFLDTGIYDRRRELIVTASPSMDILISSNLERLLYFVSDCDSALVKTLMTELSKKGRYSVDAVLKNKIGSVFLGGFCDDDATRASIAKVFNEYGYLIDPHTAVAYNVWSRLNEDELSSPHTVIVSTASPYKFCVDVLNALGADCPEGLAQFGALSELTGTAVPAPLSELDGKPVRFTDAVAADAMRGYVTAKLS
ncbi:MAG: threonine synthase, partial [Oscillospiraceae bacterium]|nr:threonine synthase [Oscillospiraceae bacterium]